MGNLHNIESRPNTSRIEQDVWALSFTLQQLMQTYSSADLNKHLHLMAADSSLQCFLEYIYPGDE